MTPHTLLLSFEPLIDKYASLLLRGRARFSLRNDFDVWPLGQHHPRGFVLPLAVAPEPGPQTISVTNTAGCSSLLNFSKNHTQPHLCHNLRESMVHVAPGSERPLHAHIDVKILNSCFEVKK